MSKETKTEEIPVETVETSVLFTNAVVEKIANGFVVRSNGNQEISAFMTKEDLMKFLDITIPEV